MSINEPITKLDYWFAGEDQTLQWTVYQSNGETIQNITGWTVEFKMARSAGGTSVLTLDGTVVTPASGLVRVDVTSNDTTVLAPRTYKYTLSRTNTGANQVLAHGDAVLQSRIQ